MPVEKSKKFKDVQTEKRIHEHLTNKNDIISDEDISNVKTDVDKTEIEGIDPKTTSAQENLSESENDLTNDAENPGSETTWNITR